MCFMIHRHVYLFCLVIILLYQLTLYFDPANTFNVITNTSSMKLISYLIDWSTDLLLMDRQAYMYFVKSCSLLIVLWPTLMSIL